MSLTSCSAFDRLNADVILEITRINANMFIDEDALTTTRHASQVCRAWRSAIINTPLVWARLIDLDALHGLKSNEWGEELVRRSGKAVLWIKAATDWTRQSHPVAAQRLFFRTIIAKNWGRVQRLVISTLVLVYREMWKVPLCSPALALEVFRIHSCDRGHSKTVGVMHQFTDLFSGWAPSLRSFSVDYHKIDLHARWLRNLRSIQLDLVYDISECLVVLSGTSDLEDLKIKGGTVSQAELQTKVHPVVRLPKLKKLHLSLNFDDINFMLDHLVVPHGCSLALSTWPCWRAANFGTIEGIVPQVISTLAQVSRRYFKSHPARKIEIGCFDNGIALQDNSGHDDSTLKMRCGYYYASYDSMVSAYTGLAFPEFAGITELALRYNVLLPSAPHVTFLGCFSAVEVLHANEQLFGDLIATQDALSKANGRPTILFPKLQRVVLRLGDGACFTSRTVGHATEAFILSRIKDGYPVPVLDLTAFSECECVTNPVVMRLKRISGLKVDWRMESDSELWDSILPSVLMFR